MLTNSGWKLFLLYLFSVNGLLIPAGAIFENAALSGIINVDEAEAFGVAFSPLEVIQQRPDEIACQRCSFQNGFSCLPDIFLQEIDAPGIVHLPILADCIGKGSTILGNIQARDRVFLMHAYQQLADASRVDLPFHLSIFGTFHDYPFRHARCSSRLLAYYRARIVVNAQKIDWACNDPGIARLCVRSRIA